MMTPTNMKRGTAMRWKESVPPNIRCTTIINGKSPWVRIPKIDATPMEMAIGVLMAKRTTRDKIKISDVTVNTF